MESFQRLLECAKEGANYGDGKMIQLVETLNNADHETLMKNGSFYHKECYKMVTNKTNLERLKNASENDCNETSIDDVEISDIEPLETPGKILRSSRVMNRKNMTREGHCIRL